MRLTMAIVASMFFWSPARASDWPSGPIKLVVPFAPGSTPDIAARIVGEQLGPRLGKAIVVENRPGGSGNTGTDAIAKAKPDGQTIGVSIGGPLAINPMLFKTMPYQAGKDFEFITIAVAQTSVLVVSNKLPVKNVAELASTLKANPQKYSFASIGLGSVSHLSMQALSSRLGAEPVHVPYNGSGAAVMALVAGDADMAALPAAAVMPLVKSGKLRALATTGATRAPALPDLPTLAESGIEDVRADSWIGFLAPSGTRPEVLSRLGTEIRAVLKDPAVGAKLRDNYMTVIAGTPAEFREQIAADVKLWSPVINKYNIKLD